jgi:hypothetical protein
MLLYCGDDLRIVPEEVAVKGLAVQAKELDEPLGAGCVCHGDVIQS